MGTEHASSSEACAREPRLALRADKKDARLPPAGCGGGAIPARLLGGGERLTHSRGLPGA